ncbi:MAG: helix-turn-helix domain-containing protein, partial [Pseudomonadota bacterium]|nr:helix-turn-helix domain-containing protein [Pseudomonadota bacterium]
EKSVVQLPPLAKGENLYRAGDPFAGLYLVKSGSFKAVMISGGGDEQVVSFCLPGAITGYDGFDGHYACTVTALEQSAVCFLSSEQFDRLSREVPALAAYVHRAMGKNFNAMSEMKLLMAQRPAEDRLTCYLFNLADCFAERGFSGREFQMSMSRHDIANFLGLAPETVSRLFTHLREEGVISMDGKWVKILDADQLRRTTCSYVGEEKDYVESPEDPSSTVADR